VQFAAGNNATLGTDSDDAILECNELENGEGLKPPPYTPIASSSSRSDHDHDQPVDV
jgi:hypothetical protein